MKEFIEKLIGRLEELYDENDKMKKKAYEEQDWENFELFTHGNEGVKEAIEIVNELAEEYKTCYKSCTECEAYDKEKHHCPKFCYIIEETVKEIKENHKGGWIPCSERLPEDDRKRYIVQKTNGLIDILGFTKDSYKLSKYDFAEYKGKKKRLFYGYDSEYGYIEYECEAWMPLPEKYKGE